MRKVVYTDDDGRKFHVLIPDSSPDSHARAGIVLGPADLSYLKLPKDLEVRLNNQLFNRGIFTLQDAVKKRQDVMAALQGALSVDIESILNCFRGYN